MVTAMARENGLRDSTTQPEVQVWKAERCRV